MKDVQITPRISAANDGMAIRLTQVGVGQSCHAMVRDTTLQAQRFAIK
jgi:hypothetical protein